MDNLIEYDSLEDAIEVAREEYEEELEEDRIDAIVEGQMNTYCYGYEFGKNYAKGNFDRFTGDFWSGFLSGTKQIEEEKQHAERLNQEEEKEKGRTTSNDEDNFTALVALGVFALQIATIIKLSVI